MLGLAHHPVRNWFGAGNQYIKVRDNFGKLVFLELAADRINKIFDSRCFKLLDGGRILFSKWDCGDKDLGQRDLLIKRLRKV